ncbi:MAG: putative quinol monooxygenase [Gammaproteobacteria bacterium]
MNKSIASILVGLSIFNFSTTALAQEETMTNKQASYIPMTAAPYMAGAFTQFLSGAAPLVKETEPGTELWFALQGTSENQLAIFDIFRDEAARDAHFSGDVAGALKAKASELVEGGWDDGVLANVTHVQVLSEKAPVDLYDATTATYIKITAEKGQGEALAELLAAAGPVVSDTEPKTLYWVALRLDQVNFAIFDIFADESGREAHFAGEVAGLLKEQSSTLVAGGWENGVVANVRNHTILAIK